MIGPIVTQGYGDPAPELLATGGYGGVPVPTPPAPIVPYGPGGGGGGMVLDPKLGRELVEAVERQRRRDDLAEEEEILLTWWQVEGF